MKKLLGIIVLSVLVLNVGSAAGATADLYMDRSLKSVHPEEATRLQPDYGRHVDMSSVKALEASVQRPVLENIYDLKALDYFSHHPILTFFLILLLLASLPIAIALRVE